MFGKVLTGSTDITPRLQLAQYCAGCKNYLPSDFSTWGFSIKCSDWHTSAKREKRRSVEFALVCARDVESHDRGNKFCSSTLYIGHRVNPPWVTLTGHAAARPLHMWTRGLLSSTLLHSAIHNILHSGDPPFHLSPTSPLMPHPLVSPSPPSHSCLKPPLPHYLLSARRINYERLPAI